MLALRLNRVAVYGRTYFVIGKMEDAKNLQSYAIGLFDRLSELMALGAPGPSLDEITLYKKLLDF